MNDYARNQESKSDKLSNLMSNLTSGRAVVSAPSNDQDTVNRYYPDLVYSNWLDEFFPCRVIAQSGGQVFIEALYKGRIVPMRVPARIVYRRPRPEVSESLTGQAPDCPGQSDHKLTTN